MSELPLTGRARADRSPHSLAEWQRFGGYQALPQALQRHSPAAIVAMVEAAGLRGRGGAGFLAGTKWRLMREGAAKSGPGARYLCVNGDETEPGSFKDRLLMEALPHQLIEGAAIAAYAVGATEVIILVRDEYRAGAAALTRAIAEAEAAGLLGRDILGSGFDLTMRVHASAGRYIVGEESALIAAIEGERPVPRHRPPYPAVSGLWGRPTTVNNVETLSAVPSIIEHGADWYLGLSRTEEGGTKLYGVSGCVARPQLIEAPMGTSARELIELAGGIRDGRALLAFQPGGGATGFLEAAELDVPMDFAHLKQAGSSLGTGALIVLDDRACPVAAIGRHARFYARESCGLCTPCRDGLPWVSKLLDALEAGQGQRGDIELLQMHVDLAGPSGRSFCDLMAGAMTPLKSGLQRFGEIFAAHLEGACPVGRA
ncbi:MULTISPECIES: NADH-ubiquinone oxidoreductase-F iron-sulfur binding region domain-containing protein [Rhodopseudomonas]|uniref:NADH dehydrogenase n=1 Tax=Rhodopseudomonas palustris TaxID=1076 RepID=A0A0D7F3V3_RHOPL|nr:MULTISPECIES: NADH-ubiquinone oxidoreductase-F iron-sulfur binding region domain-containing protein [Rhodopseudomonas]KIZ47480.1 NADH dehydrogenase [Rhodopseudomonas palustris]MDF3813866.1 NADH-ubiquinone oxidoreductase-F iron-sulfur binding region domain-containing protein [Rhodopseudomonas sp. BAL398]WOK15457.1 NADH-ubiquinone oxidoreductase-F iron-sulfur binding region domain-containing protein [Rhodopseudomonas sp. BAL398]